MGCIFFLFTAFVLVGCSGRKSVNTRNLCNRDPPNIASRRTPGDNGLRIQVLGHSEKYTPGQVYTISINGTYPNQRLLGFMLVAVPLNAQDETTAMGTFQLIDTVQTKFATECPHVVTHTNLRPKAGVDVLWTAPAPRVGCIEFRATVIERDNVWFKDDGALTKEFCEDTGTTESQRSAELTPDCCACGSAKYQMTFEGKWSQQSHPKDYPTQRRLLHWSNIVGASHSKNYMVWQYGDYATKGVKEVCEFGYPRTTEQEIQSHSREVRSIIKTSGIWYSEPHGINQKRDARFSTDRRRHLVSMLTMIGPSPDWCVGVSALDLCLPNCTWTKEITLDLYPWDAGTDDGISYMSQNAKSNPQQKIHRITNAFPNNVASPFYGRDPVKALASLKIERLSEKDGGDSSCSNEDTDDSNVDIIGGGGGDGVGADVLSEMDKQKLMMKDGKCAVSAWDDWSGCSVTCGVGQRFRKRMYLNPTADETMCGLPVMESENCIGLENECETIEEDCAVTQWSNWSPCSVTCGKGSRERRRFYLSKEDMVRCNRTTEEVAMCAAAILDCDGAKARKNFSAICALPSMVGPCRGNFERWYFDTQMQKCLPFVYGGCRGNENRFETMDECTEACSFFHETEESVQESTQRAVATPARCSLPSLTGPCRANQERWYFDVQMQKCLPFTYGGCRGNENRFETMDECTEACSLYPDTEESVQESTQGTVATPVTMESVCVRSCAMIGCGRFFLGRESLNSGWVGWVAQILRRCKKTRRTTGRWKTTKISNWKKNWERTTKWSEGRGLAAPGAECRQQPREQRRPRRRTMTRERLLRDADGDAAADGEAAAATADEATVAAAAADDDATTRRRLRTSPDPLGRLRIHSGVSGSTRASPASPGRLPIHSAVHRSFG